jgi:hypothetical protein
LESRRRPTRRRCARTLEDPYSKASNGTEWCPECYGYGSSLFEETERCTRCGGTGLVMLADEREQESNGGERRRLGRAK